MATQTHEKKKLKQIISDFFSGLWVKYINWYRVSKFGKVVEQVCRFIGYAFWPFGWIREKTLDKLRFDQQKKVVSLLFMLPAILGFLIFFLYPLVMSFVYSFSTLQITENGLIIHFSKFFEKGQDFVNPISTDLFYNYKYAFTQNADFPVQLLATVGTMFTDTIVITIFSLLIAVMLNGKFKGRTLVRAIFFLPVIFNSDAIASALAASESLTNSMAEGGANALTNLFDISVFMQGIGLPKFLVTFLSGITNAIYDTISYSGIQILIFLTAIQSVPKQLYEAAKMEGCTQYEMFWKITLPMVSPMIMTVVVYTVVDSFLRSGVSKVIDLQQNLSQYGYHAAMSWAYFGSTLLFLMVVLGILSKVVFYYDDKK